MLRAIETKETAVSLVAKVLTPVSQSYPGGSRETLTYTRRMPVIRKVDGEIVEVPILSAQSMRHSIHTVLADALLKEAEIEPRELTVRIFGLLYQGGALAGKGSGRYLTAAESEELAECLPVLPLMGGSIAGRLEASHISVSPLFAYSAEYGPADAGFEGHEFFTTALPEFAPESAASLVTEMINTRTSLVQAGSANADNAEDRTSPLPYSHEAIIPGTYMFGWCEPLPGMLQPEKDALAWALTVLYRNGDVLLGAHDATAEGHVRVTLDEEALRHLGNPEAFTERLDKEKIRTMLLKTIPSWEKEMEEKQREKEDKKKGKADKNGKPNGDDAL